MKNCPHCDAEIYDNGYFCLNCMQSLKQKQSVKFKPFALSKRLLSALACFLLCVLTAVSVGLFLNFYRGNSGTDTTIIERIFTTVSSSSSQNSSDDISSYKDKAPSAIEGNNQNINSVNNGTSHQTSSGSDNNSQIIGGGFSQSGSSFINSGGFGQIGGIVGGGYTSTPPYSSDNLNSNSSDTIIDNSTSPPQSSGNTSGGTSNDSSGSPTYTNGFGAPVNVVPANQVRYTYRALTKHDLEFKTEFYLSGGYPSNYCDNKIVLTGVLDASDNGVYIIPEKIDGYEVHTISGYLFASSVPSKVKCVVLPKTVKSITHNAFAFCTNLENVYCLSTYLDCETYAFCDELFSAPVSDKITFYCLDKCLAPTYNEPVYFKDRHFLEDITVKVWDGVLPF